MRIVESRVSTARWDLKRRKRKSALTNRNLIIRPSRVGDPAMDGEAIDYSERVVGALGRDGRKDSRLTRGYLMGCSRFED